MTRPCKRSWAGRRPRDQARLLPDHRGQRLCLGRFASLWKMLPLRQEHFVTLPGYHAQFVAKLFSGAPPGLDRMAVRTEGDHLLWAIRTTFGEILDVIHLEDRVADIRDVLRLSRTVRTLATPFAT